MGTFSDRVREARKELGLTQIQLAAAAGLSQTTISDIERGRNDSSADIVSLARAIGVRAEWLADGRGPRKDSDSPALDEPSNVSPGPERRARVPLISWVQAGDWSHAADLFQPGDAEDWVETSVAVRSHTFALRVKGDSMEPEFMAGTLVVVEPEMDAHPGDFVIARNGDGEATFKQLTIDGPDLYLKPLNPRYPIKPLGTARIVGVVREAVKRYR
jgi:SOS-response transcriptional repressor LexA